MRYNVGQTYLFTHVSFEDNGHRFFSSLFMPTVHTLKKIDTLKLVCTEHHKVASAYGDESDLSCDGFLFTETKENAEPRSWANQYPLAHYGQLDDSQDRMVRLHIDEAKFESMSEEEKDWYVFTRYTDTASMLSNIRRAYTKDREKVELSDADVEKFKDYENKMVETVIQQGGSVEWDHLKMKKLDGTVVEVKNVPIARITMENKVHEH